MRRFIGGKTADSLLALALVVGAWKVLTLIYPPLVVPGIAAVGDRLWAILTSGRHLQDIGLTVLRLVIGLCLGVGAGAGLGLLLGHSRRLERICRPLLGLLQAVPPISWLVLAMLWFGFNGRASVFIVAVAAMPIMVVNIVEGLANVDRKLLEMGRVYSFSGEKRLRYIVVPSVIPYFRAGLRIVAGNGCKIGLFKRICGHQARRGDFPFGEIVQ